MAQAPGPPTKPAFGWLGWRYSCLCSIPDSHPSPQVVKTRRDEPFKLTPSGCFLSMWISSDIRGESLLLTLCGTGTLACDSTFSREPQHRGPRQARSWPVGVEKPSPAHLRRSILRPFCSTCVAQPPSAVCLRSTRQPCALASSQLPRANSVLFTHAQARAIIQLV